MSPSESFAEVVSMIPRRQFSMPSAPLTEQLWDANTLRIASSWRIPVPAPVLDEFVTFCAGRQIDAGFASNCDLAGLVLPLLQEFATQIGTELATGTGVAWVTNLSLECFGEPAVKLFFAALGSAMGKPMEQYGRLYEVRDTGQSYRDKPIPISQTRAETSFHTDSSARDTLPDSVGLLCLQPALEGGDSLICSATAVHEKLRAAHPEDLGLLYQDFIRDIVTPGAGQKGIAENRFPVFSYGYYGSGLTFRYMRYWIETGCRRAGLPLTEAELKVFDRLDALLGSSEQVVQLRLGVGEMLWLNNHTIAHNRTEFHDHPAKPRRMLRMWLARPSQ
jgi:alpha-ketoglutarate-dependent taurine dioxygenase